MATGRCRMPRRKMYVEWDEEADLSDSQKHPGKRSPLLRDADGNLVGHVVLSDVEDDGDDDEDDIYMGDPMPPAEEDDEELTLAQTLAAAALLLAVIEAAPHVTRWWNGHALPAIKATKMSAQNRIAKIRKPQKKAHQGGLTPAAIPRPPVPDVAPAHDGAVLTSDEAQQLLLAALIARAFSDEQLRTLLNARIEDPEHVLQMKRTLERYTTTEVEGQIRLMLEAKPTLIEEFAALLPTAGQQGVPALVPRNSVKAAGPPEARI